MTDLALFPELMPEEQFRAVRLQVHNWGTFSGCNDIPIAEEGFLFVGASGSGKSTLLDAFSQLLIPPRWVDFNAAAHETGGKVQGRPLDRLLRPRRMVRASDRCGRDNAVPARGDDRLGPCAHLPQRPPHRDAPAGILDPRKAQRRGRRQAPLRPSSNETSTSRPSSPAFRSPTTTSGVSSSIWRCQVARTSFRPTRPPSRRSSASRAALRSHPSQDAVREEPWRPQRISEELHAR